MAFNEFLKYMHPIARLNRLCLDHYFEDRTGITFCKPLTAYESTSPKRNNLKYDYTPSVGLCFLFLSKIVPLMKENTSKNRKLSE